MVWWPPSFDWFLPRTPAPYTHFTKVLSCCLQTPRFKHLLFLPSSTLL